MQYESFENHISQSQYFNTGISETIKGESHLFLYAVDMSVQEAPVQLPKKRNDSSEGSSSFASGFLGWFSQ